MDEEMRGYIESGMENLIDESDFVGTARWIADNTPHQNLKDLAVGCFVGAAFVKGQAMVLAKQKSLTQEDKLQLLRIIKRWLPEIMEKINKELGR